MCCGGYPFDREAVALFIHVSASCPQETPSVEHQCRKHQDESLLNQGHHNRPSGRGHLWTASGWDRIGGFIGIAAHMTPVMLWG